jgi:DNA helicase-2/ATP-dependent DNA helicase PcrA
LFVHIVSLWYLCLMRKFTSIRTSRQHPTGGEEHDACVSWVGSVARPQHSKYTSSMLLPSLILAYPAVSTQSKENTSTSFAIVLDLAKTASLLDIPARSLAIKSSQPATNPKETSPSLCNQVVASDNTRFSRPPTEVAMPYSRSLPAKRFRLPPETCSPPDNQTKSSGSVLTEIGTQRPLAGLVTAVQGVKRRLGMGRGGAGYSNKKFKPPV